MNYVLDTHTLLWFTGGDKRLSARSRELIEDTEHKVMVSAASLFEIAIKVKIGKMVLIKPLDGIYRDIQIAAIEVIPILLSHLDKYQDIPLYADHRDPFDRLIIASTIVEQAELISIDPKFQYYTDLVKIVW